VLALSSWQIAYCCIVIVAAYAVRGGTGFGSAAAMPLLALVVPLKLLVPVWTLLGVASSVTIVAHDYRQIAVREMLRTVPAGLIGIAAGLYAFKTLDTRTLTMGLGALVIAYGCWSLWTVQMRWNRNCVSGFATTGQLVPGDSHWHGWSPNGANWKRPSN